MVLDDLPAGVGQRPTLASVPPRFPGRTEALVVSAEEQTGNTSPYALELVDQFSKVRERSQNGKCGNDL